MSQLLANGENFMTNANEVLVRLNQLLAPDNQQRLVTTLDNLALVTQTVADQRGDLRTLLQQLAQASKQANETLTQTNRLLRNANGLMDGQGKQLVSDAAKTMASLQNTSTILNKLVSENKTSLNNGMQGMNELGPAVDELRRTLATLRAAVSRLKTQRPCCAAVKETGVYALMLSFNVMRYAGRRVWLLMISGAILLSPAPFTFGPCITSLSSAGATCSQCATRADSKLVITGFTTGDEPVS
jgi:ABC-type transporter Mla subunit MlaD